MWLSFLVEAWWFHYFANFTAPYLIICFNLYLTICSTLISHSAHAFPEIIFGGPDDILTSCVAVILGLKRSLAWPGFQRSMLPKKTDHHSPRSSPINGCPTWTWLLEYLHTLSTSRWNPIICFVSNRTLDNWFHKQGFESGFPQVSTRFCQSSGEYLSIYSSIIPPCHFTVLCGAAELLSDTIVCSASS